MGPNWMKVSRSLGKTAKSWGSVGKSSACSDGNNLYSIAQIHLKKGYNPVVRNLKEMCMCDVLPGLERVVICALILFAEVGCSTSDKIGHK
ncbi:similar to spinocerebellar ataxia 7 homolog (predicted), isoform CRA_c [Rattus norvegicus]|uniref:Similar to spinocerebellar ataxia 7 homolog (Predicted), isoform CRA_c n=1 Tax=Rattus norvegicus TaxID=10116 RepID=A6K073_RAT|nr:similar to spinocerebellar ataxia 7 homolog (predicted), isoform CRA_c [Rattus norvegicus]